MSCPLAKQCKLSFPNASTSVTTSIFELLHVDVLGPYPISTHHGCKYFLTIVDDNSRATWTYLIPTTQHVHQLLLDFLAYANTQFDKSVKIMRSHNGTEFFNKYVLPHLSHSGIIHQSSCVKNPQQNARVERKHRHLLEVARALRFQSGLPIKYWGECLLAATFIINRLPTPVLYHKTPHEILFSKPIVYDHMRVFGCLAYASVHSHDKFASRAIKGVSIGYPSGQKGYKILDLDNHKIFVSRDVVFHETIFPFLLSSSVSSHSASYEVIPWGTTDEQSVVVNENVQGSPLVSPNEHVHDIVIDIMHDSSPNSQTVSSASQPTITQPIVSKSTDSPSTSKSISHNAPSRTSTRVKNRPQWWSDYDVNVKSTNYLSKAGNHSVNTSGKISKHSLSNYVSYHAFDPSHLKFIANLSLIKEPTKADKLFDIIKS